MQKLPTKVLDEMDEIVDNYGWDPRARYYLNNCVSYNGYLYSDINFPFERLKNSEKKIAELISIIQKETNKLNYSNFLPNPSKYLLKNGFVEVPIKLSNIFLLDLFKEYDVVKCEIIDNEINFVIQISLNDTRSLFLTCFRNFRNDDAKEICNSLQRNFVKFSCKNKFIDSMILLQSYFDLPLTCRKINKTQLFKNGFFPLRLEFSIYPKILFDSYITIDEKIKDYFNFIAQDFSKKCPCYISQYILFLYCKTVFKDAIYQYRADFLGYQSFDIFIPSLKIAVEYNGKQHYEKIDYFHKTYERFEENIKLDQNKIDLCKKNHIKLLVWKYDLDLTFENFLIFFKDFISLKQLKCSLKNLNGFKINDYIWDTNKTKKCSKKYEINKYSLKGKYLTSYPNYLIASEANNISIKSIEKACSSIESVQKAGDYLWRRQEINNHLNIKSYKPFYLPKTYKLFCVDENGEVIKVFNNLSSASREMHVSGKCITDCLKGLQKKAAGYYWKIN